MANDSSVIRALEKFIELEMARAHLPGMAIALTDRERLLWSSTFGYSNLDAKIPVTPQTLFEIGSISKSFTSIVLLQLQEQGLLDLDEPVTRYLPWFKVQSEYSPITLKHLMSHSAGIIRGMEFSGEARFETWALRNTRAAAPPGERYHYSNVGYKILNVVLEDVLCQSFGEIIQERILDPLGMPQTAPIITNDIRGQLAVGYEAFFDDRPMPANRPLAPATWLEYRWGDGSVASTARDMASYLRMFLNFGRVDGKTILSETSMRRMMAPAIEAVEEGDGSAYGYGLGIYEQDSHTVIGHSGGMVGYYAQIMADRTDGFGVVVLTNGPGCRDDEIAKFALRLLRANKSGKPMPPMPAIDLTKVEDATAFAGTYTAAQNPLHMPGGTSQGPVTFTMIAEDQRLYLLYGGERILLEPRGQDSFYVNHPDFAFFLLRFGREKDQIVEAFHGPNWYPHERYRGPRQYNFPAEWTAYTGHYRSHNPWDTNFRVVLQKGSLRLIYPSGEEHPLVQMGEGEFRVGKEQRSPESIRFDILLDGQAIRANLSCGDYYRAYKASYKARCMDPNGD